MKFIKTKIIKKIFFFLQKLRFFETSKKRKIFRFFFKNKKIFINNQLIPELKNGMLKISNHELKSYDNPGLEIVNKSINLFNKKTITTGSKSYLRNILLDKDEDEIKYFLHFFLQEKFINIVKKYLETDPLLVELKLLWSPKMVNNIITSGSQLFHLDYDDDKIVKFFFNIFEVDSKSGPLQIVDKKNSQKIKDSLDIGLGNHDDKIITENMSPRDIISLNGQTGDLFLVDTSSCFHRGSAEVEKDRLILYCNFVSKNSYRFIPIFKQFEDKDIIKNHSPLFKYKELVPNRYINYLINT